MRYRLPDRERVYARSVSAESELELRVAALDPRQFERPVFDLVRDEFPEAKALRAPDMGADTLALSSEGQPTRVWQAKHFNGRPKWTDFARSLQDASAAYAPRSVVFVFSRDLTGPQVKAFERHLRDAGGAAGVEVDYWSLSTLRERLQRNPRVRVRYFSYDAQTLTDLYASRAGQTDPLTALSHLDAFFEAEDPGFQYDTEVMRRSSLPDPPMVEGAAATLIVGDGGTRVIRAAINARDGDAGPMVVWNFADNKQGRDARDHALLATARGDTEVLVDAAALALALHKAPRPLRDQFEPTPPGELIGRFAFTPGPGIPVTITAQGATSQLTKEFTVYPFPPAPWAPFGLHDRAYVGLDGAFMPFFAIRLDEDEDGRGDIAFAPQLNLGTSASENVEALRFWRALNDSERVELTGQLFPKELMQIHPGKLVSSMQTRQRLAFLEGLYETVVMLEERLRRDLPVHAPPITEEELIGLDGAVSAVIDRRMTVTVAGSFEVTVTRQTAQTHAQWLQGRPPVVLPLSESVFGTVIDLGRALGRMPEVDVIEIPHVTDASGVAELRVVIRGPHDIACRVLEDGEQPPGDAVDLSAWPRPG
jgi:hypothetical protein